MTLPDDEKYGGYVGFRRSGGMYRIKKSKSAVLT